ncbi:hypothetical protein QL285_026765 [Trifolium repens]|nr:hypothetical protein QL285_026765 [Trifolium repens]
MCLEIYYGIQLNYVVRTAFPRTRPGQCDDHPWKQSKLGFLEKKREAWSALTKSQEQKLKQLQDPSDADRELIDILHNQVQSMLALLENYEAEIKLEK